MKTISTAYYAKMAEAKRTFCAFCMRGGYAVSGEL